MPDPRYLPPDRPPRKPGQHPTAQLTLEAYVRIRRELEELKTVGRTRMAERLLRARELGDIRENAEYDTAKNDQALMEARIRDLEFLLKDPDIVEATDAEEVQGGVLVTLRVPGGEDGDEETYLIGHSNEERAPGVRTVTTSSPLGAAVLGKRVGDTVTYQAPAGSFTYEIVRLEPHRPA